jgi:hypothetical protein
VATAAFTGNGYQQWLLTIAINGGNQHWGDGEGMRTATRMATLQGRQWR